MILDQEKLSYLLIKRSYRYIQLLTVFTVYKFSE